MRVTDRSRLDQMLRSQSIASQRLDKASRIASSGQNVTKPSDDPVAYGTMVRRDYALARMNQQSTAAGQAQDELDVVGNSLSSAADVLEKVRETAVSAANESSDPNARKLMAQDVRTMRQELLSVANTKYNNKYLFGGTKTDSEPFDSTTAAFTGNSQIVNVPVGDGVAPPGNISGAKVFTAAGGRDIFADLDALATALDNNDLTGIQASLDPLQAGHDQIVSSEVEASHASERFSNAADVLVQTKSAVTASLSKQIDGDPAQQLTELTLAKTAYEQSIAVTKEILSVNTGS